MKQSSYCWYSSQKKGREHLLGIAILDQAHCTVDSLHETTKRAAAVAAPPPPPLFFPPENRERLWRHNFRCCEQLIKRQNHCVVHSRHAHCTNVPHKYLDRLTLWFMVHKRLLIYVVVWSHARALKSLSYEIVVVDGVVAQNSAQGVVARVDSKNVWKIFFSKSLLISGFANWIDCFIFAGAIILWWFFKKLKNLFIYFIWE